MPAVLASEAVTVAIIAAIGGVAAAGVSAVAAIASTRSRRVLSGLHEQLSTGNGHTPGQALAMLERAVFDVRTLVDAAVVRLAEQHERIVDLDSRLSAHTALLAEHLVEVSRRTRELGPLVERLTEQGGEHGEGSA